MAWINSILSYEWFKIEKQVIIDYIIIQALKNKINKRRKPDIFIYFDSLNSNFISIHNLY